ncbi:MAG: tyrosine-type recombinase/integrase [Pseudonocardiales bacterium]|nr:tyrosine-type recombinase/integrase [Pseudonocardiales bacterium]
MGRASSKVSKVVVAGPLAPFAEGIKARLEELGYTPLSAVTSMRLMVHVSRWLDAHGMTAADLTSERVEQYLRERRAAGYARSLSPRSLAVLLGLLGSMGVLVAEEPARCCSESEALLASFRDYLLGERALASSTALAYVLRARRFLAGRDPEVGLAGLTAADVSGAVLGEASAGSVGSTQFFVVALRAFLRFCFIQGLVPADLSAAALTMTGRRRPGLPKGISRAEAMALLGSCDRRRSAGLRDYAVLVILLRLGLRAGEVAALTLDDLEWRAGELVVHGKGHRVDRLPLPADVGEAITAYLRRGRPRTTRREVFLRTVAPIAPLTRRGVSLIVRSACLRAGVAPVGAHRLRHTLACDMVRAGVPLPEISQVLRHRSLVSTAIYARADVDQLRMLAQPWPSAGVGR